MFFFFILFKLFYQYFFVRMKCCCSAWLLQSDSGFNYNNISWRINIVKNNKQCITVGNRHKQNSWFCKKFVRITSGFGGGEFTKTFRKVCTCQKLKFAFLLLEYCKIRECYAVANVFTIRNMHSLLLYMKCNSRKINRPTKNMTKIVTLLHF